MSLSLFFNSYIFLSSSSVSTWSRVFDGTVSDVGYGLACDSTGNVYLSGWYARIPYIYDQTGILLDFLPQSVNNTNAAFVAKFNASGVFQWARIIDGTGTEQGQSVTCDSSGNVYFSGLYDTASPTIKDQKGNSLGTLPAPSGSFVSFVCKFDSSGTYQYSRIVDGSGNENGSSVACDSTGNMYLAGYYATASPTIYTVNTSNVSTAVGTLPSPSGGSYSVYVCKFNSSGTYQYSRVVDGTGTDQGLNAACDSTGNMYLAGFYATGAPTIYTVSSSNVSVAVGTLPAPSGGSYAAFVSKFDSSGNYQYSRVVDGTGTETGQYLTCDSTGNMYLAGNYQTAAPTIYTVNTSNVSVAVGTLPAPSVGSNAAFVSKFDSSGTYQYSRVVDGTGYDDGRCVACDSTGNMYFSGSYQQTAAPTIYTVNTSNVSVAVGTLVPAPAGSNAAFVCKFNSTGVYQYSRVIDGTGNEVGYNVACDSSGNMYLAGIYGPASPTIYTVSSSNVSVAVGTLPTASGTSTGAFVCKFDSNGGYNPTTVVSNTWSTVSACTTNSTSTVNGVTTDSSGNIYFVGTYSGTAILYDQAGRTLVTLPAANLNAAFVSKYTSGGYHQWTRILDGTGNEFGYGVACDSSGNVYFAGYYDTAAPTIKNQAGTTLGTLPAPAGSFAVFVSKFDSSGAYQYSRVVDGTGSDQGYGVTCDSSGNMYLVGYYQTASPTIKDQAGTALATLPASVGSYVSFVCKFNSSGVYQYSEVVDGTGADICYSVACDSSGNMYLAGHYNTSSPTIYTVSSSNVSVAVGTLPAPSGGSYAAFVSKFDSTGTYQYSRVIDGTGNEYSFGLACDFSGNMYLAGQYSTASPTIYTVNSSNVATAVATLRAPSVTSAAAYVSKFDSSGTYQYSRVVDGSGTEQGNGVSCDSSGNVYFVGQYATASPTIYTVSSSNVSVSVATLPAPSGGSNAAYVSKFDSSGTYQYSRVVDATGTDTGQSVACDSSGNMYFAGRNGPSSSPIIYSVNSSNVSTIVGTLPNSAVVTTVSSGFVTKFDSTGAYSPPIPPNTFARIVDGTGGDDTCYSVTCDSFGNMYVAGYYVTGAAAIKDQSGNTLFTLPAPSSVAAFISKFGTGGLFQWARIVDGTGTEYGYGISCDSSGNVYLAGYYDTSSPTIKDQAGTSLGTLPAPLSSSYAAFVSKFDSSGTYQYSRVVDGTGFEVGRSVACDSSGNMYLAGQYDTASPTIYTVSSSNVSVAVATLPAPSGGGVAFVCKFDSSGAYQYSRVVDGTGNEVGQGVSCDSTGNMYISGWYSSSSPTIYTVSSSNVSTSVGTLPAPSSSAAFVCKFDSTGTYQYSRVVDGTGNEVGYGVACDSSGNMYLAGQYATASPTIKAINSSNVSTSVATLPAPSGGGAAFVCKFDSSGTYQYSRVVDGTGTEVGQGVSCDSTGNMYLSGYYDTASPTIYTVSSSNVSTSVGTLPAPSGGSQAAFVCKFDSSGTYQYLRVVDGTGGEVGYGVACDSSGNMYFSGQYSTAAPTIKDQAGNSLGTLPAPSTAAGFIVKFDSKGNYSP
jgi:hypothetical protein